MRSLFSRSRPSFPCLSCAVPVLAVLCAALFVWAGESLARPEYASIQAGFGPAKVSYLPVTVGGKTLQIKVPEDFVLAEGVEETEWYKDVVSHLVDAESIPLLIFILPDDLRMLKESSEYKPDISITVSVYSDYTASTLTSSGFAEFREHVRRTRNELDGVPREIDDAPDILNYIYEDDSLIAFIFTPDISDPELADWWPVAESHFMLDGKVITLYAELDGVAPQTAFTLLKNLVLQYFER